MHDTFSGVISVTGRGFGYIPLPDDPDTDLEITPERINTALNKDTVTVRRVTAPAGVRPQAEVVRIERRAKTRFVGVLESPKAESDFFFLKADDKRMYKDLFIHASKAKGAKRGDKVLAELVSWLRPDKSPEGAVLEVIGRGGKHETEMQAIVLEYGFETRFPSDVETEAHDWKEREKRERAEEAAKRRDFRETLTFTVDPADAKDFDDALSLKDLGGGRYEIGVHIADVSHFVRPGTALDREALRRGTSVYLVDRTIPMLPEVLSNDLCSLNPNEDKLAFSAVFVMDENARVHERWFGKSIIHSARRFTYEEAQERIESGQGDLAEELGLMNRIAKVLQKQKFANGAIEFETDEVKFELDSEGKPIRVIRKVRKDAHKMIEEFMLLANREVAFYMYDEKTRTRHPGSFIYRIHDAPDKDRIVNLSIFLKAMGYNLPGEDGEVTAEELNNVLKQAEGKPEESLVKTAAIRSMSKAIYSTKNIGHFGLGFSYYTHFTSPIRRYPDLLVHRLLERYLTKGKVPQDEMGTLERIAMECSAREVSAADAERASVKYKQVEYMTKHVGETFVGTVSGVSEWGIFVEENETKAEGMIRLKTLSDDTYVLDQKQYCVIGQTTKKKFSLGDAVTVKLATADMDKRILDWEFVSKP